MKQLKILQLIPIFLAFFAMGFVDMVGIATNYVQKDFMLSDTLAGLLPSMIFLWFLVFSIPTGMLMNKIGRRKTVLLSLAVTSAGLFIPSFAYNFYSMFLCFSLLGIGNTLMQVSLNPLVSNIVSENRIASTLTLGQFIKAIASFVAPIIAAHTMLRFNNWTYLFPIFATIALIAFVYLFFTPIREQETKEKTSSFAACFRLLGNKTVLLLFVGILCHVGIDVGLNLTAPKLLMERYGMELSEAGFAISLYFLFRTLGCFAGAILLLKVSPRSFFAVSLILMLVAVAGFFVASSPIFIYVCIALVGVGNSNIFPVIFSQGMADCPDMKNEVSGLMVMGISGGALFPLLMGVASDSLGSQNGALIILALCMAYLVILIPKIRNKV